MSDDLKIIEKLRAAANVLLLTHVSPDGDTVGCAAALYHAIKSTAPHKRAVIFSPEKFWQNKKYELLAVPDNKYTDIADENFIKQFDLIVACDCGEMNRTKLEKILPQRACPLINIDHHKHNSLYGDINVVDECAAATAEIIFELLLDAGAINARIATCLLLGIITDTDWFSITTTTPRTLKITDELVKFGADLPALNRNVWQNKTPASLKYWAQIFSRLKVNKKLGIAIIVAPDDLMREIQENDSELTHEINDFLNYISEVKMAIILKPDAAAGIIKGSARTTSDKVDVGALAAILGGGGHKKAAGFSFPGGTNNNADTIK